MSSFQENIYNVNIFTLSVKKKIIVIEDLNVQFNNSNQFLVYKNVNLTYKPLLIKKPSHKFPTSNLLSMHTT